MENWIRVLGPSIIVLSCISLSLESHWGMICKIKNFELCNYVWDGKRIMVGIGFPFGLWYSESILIDVHCRQLHWFFVKMLQLCHLRIMDISELIAMVGSIRCEEMWVLKRISYLQLWDLIWKFSILFLW